MRGPTLLTPILVAMVTATLTAPAQAAPPTADSGPDQMAPVGTDVVLQGSASDPDDDPLDIQWLQSVVAGGDLSSCTFTGPTSFEPISPAGLMPTLNCTQPGQYLFQLVAADGMDFDDSLGALITFTENTPPTVDSGPDQSAPAGTDVMLQGSASDPDGQPLEIRWLRSVIADGDLSSCTFTGPTSFEPISPAGLMPTLNCGEPGQYLVQLVAADGMDFEDSLGALITFTEEPIDDLTAPTCRLGNITRWGATVLVMDSESGVASIRTRKRAFATAWPWARRYDPPEPSVKVHVRRILHWLGGLVGIEAVNGQGLKSTCWVVLPAYRDPLVINYPGGTD